MPTNRHTRLVLLALAFALLLACQIGPQPTAPPTPTVGAQTVDRATATASTTATRTPTPTRAATSSPSAAPTPLATPTPTQTVPPLTPTPASAPLALPPLPDGGPLPAMWTAIELGAGADLNPLYPTDLVLDVGSGRGYVLSSCMLDSLHEGITTQPCVSILDLATDRVLRTVAMPGSSTYGALILDGDTLYLHHPWTADLVALDPETLAVRQARSGIYGLADDGQGMTYVVTADGLTRLGSDLVPQPVARTRDDVPVAMAADEDRVYVVGYDALQVFDADLEPVADVALADGQLRSVSLDAARDRLYVGDYDGLYAFDAATGAFAKTPAEILNARAIVVAPGGERLYTFTRLPGWFSGTEVAVVDTRTWEVRVLYSTLSGELRGMARDDDRLLIASANDHALIPLDLDTGEVAHRLPIGLRVAEAIVEPAAGPDAGRLYVSDSAGWIHVLDRQTYAERARLYGGQQISLDTAHGRLYAGDPRLPVVTAFDTGSLEVLRTYPQAGRPRADAATGQVVIVNRRFYVYDGASGAPQGRLEPGIGIPAEECAGCYYTIGTDVMIDARSGLTMPLTYTPWPGKPGPQESIDIDPATGRAYYALQTGGYVHYSSIALYPDLGALRTRALILSLEGLSGHIRLDVPTRRLYVTRGRYLYVLDSETLQRLGRVDAVDWAPVIAAVDENLGRLYAPRDSQLVVWTREGDAPPAPLPHARTTVTGTVTAILPSPDFAADNTLLATIDSRLCRSTDGGESWFRLRGGLPELGDYTPTVHALFSPDYGRDRTLFYSAYLAETHGVGIYRSADGGETWHPSDDGLYDLRVYQIVPSPRYAEDGTLLAYARSYPGEALYRSTDRGASWRLVVRQVEYGTPPLPRPAEVFATREHRPQYRCDYDGRCERSADGGESWAPLDTAQFHMDHLVDYALSPDYDRDRTVYLLTQGALFRYDERAQQGAICTDRPLYDPRDYTNGFTSIAATADGEGAPMLFLGSTAGEFLRYAVDDLTWEVVWPLAVPPTPAPTPSPTPCAHAVDARFLVDAKALPARLYCPVAPTVEIYAAYQPFELGLMFWRQDQRSIYVLQQDGTWAHYDDTWQEGQPDRDPALTPPPGRYQPVRGFGLVWREWLGGAEAWIGWATAEERGGPALVQPFGGGTLLRAVNEVTYALYSDGTWTSMP